MPSAPPTSPESLPQRPPVWPAVLGTLCAVLGGLGVMAYGCGMLISSAGTAVLRYLPAADDAVAAAQLEVFQRFLPWYVVSALVSAALSGLLLVVGIGLARRRPWARRAALTWAVLRAAWAVPGGFLGYAVNHRQIEAMEEAAAGGTAMPMGFSTLMTSMGVAGVLIGILVAWALPGFLLVWLNRARIREEIAGWQPEVKEL